MSWLGKHGCVFVYQDFLRPMCVRWPHYVILFPPVWSDDLLDVCVLGLFCADMPSLPGCRGPDGRMPSPSPRVGRRIPSRQNGVGGVVSLEDYASIRQTGACSLLPGREPSMHAGPKLEEAVQCPETTQAGAVKRRPASGT